MNSVKLIEYSEKFDLIWVDGYHLSPTVIMDITNAVRLLRNGGIALCDDVYLKSSWIEIDSDLSSKMALEELASTNLISLSYIYKRIGKKFNNFAVGSKRLGVAIKN
jgi:predicted O-methyltransferase YrrM